MARSPDYQRGDIQLYLGDCVEILPQITGVDVVITSPPYNCGKEYGTHEDAMSSKDYWSWIEDVAHSATGTLAAHGYLCLNHGNYIGSRETREYVPDEMRPLLDRCLPFVDWIIWDKGPANGAAWGNFRTSPRLRSQHENIWIHGGCGQMPPSDITWPEWSQFTTSIWRIATTDVDSTIHPAMMPREVARRLALLYSPAGGTVLDPFTGSGTTGLACIATGRKFIGIEIDPIHFQTTVKRINKALDDDRASLWSAKDLQAELQ